MTTILAMNMTVPVGGCIREPTHGSKVHQSSHARMQRRSVWMVVVIDCCRPVVATMVLENDVFERHVAATQSRACVQF
eukprot:52264-Eustigmatos_ZCMA.PRE.1